MKVLLATMAGLACASISFAASETLRDGFTMRNGQMLITENGKTQVMADDMRLHNGTEVRTDGLVIPENAERFDLKEGETLDFDGTVAKADEGMVVTATAVDGVAMKGGQVLLTSNGRTTVVTNEVTLHDGTRVSSDGSVTTASGQKLRLKDGERISMDGKIEKGGD